MEDQIMFFGAQGAAQDTMYLPDGVAAQFPPGLDIIHEIALCEHHRPAG